jgi:alkylated DNA repair dioxygenase AlkB
VRDFLTFEEEATLVEWLSPQRWQPSKRNGKCLSLHWGVVIDYSGAVPRTRMPRAEAGELPLPSELQFILERFTQHVETGSAWHPNECNANEYVRARGDYLTPHFDDRKLSGDIICNVNLLSDCVMQFSKPGSTSAPFRVKLPRFSASVMSRSSRFEYRHEILHEDFLGERRISLNFRQQSPPPV